ncbi:nucleoside-diphosphate sugar epimerase [Paenibacillus sp. 1P07SE]|uniref:nucleoside-diphosphate sugar epimerase n=1 Tax=Paenibacillus sp. 1P07SE TaxID=3132209 RepID=UPI0039A48709
MEHSIDQVIEHLSASQRYLARILDAERHVAVRMGEVIDALPDQDPAFEGVPELIENVQLITKSVVGYLNSLADLEETLADQLSHVMKELDGGNDE